MSLFWNHKWSGKCTRSDLRGSKNQKFSLSIILPPLVYFSKWNPGSHRVETNRRREINEMNRSNRKGSWVGGCISAWKLRRSDRHFCSCSCFRLSIHWTCDKFMTWEWEELAHGRGATVQPLGEREKLLEFGWGLPTMLLCSLCAAPLLWAQWLSGDSIWLVFKRSSVQIPAGPGIYCGF